MDSTLEHLKMSANQADIADPPVWRGPHHHHTSGARINPARMTKAQMVAWCQASAVAIEAGAVAEWPKGLNQRRAMRILGITTVRVARTTGDRVVPADAWAEARRALAAQVPTSD